MMKKRNVPVAILQCLILLMIAIFTGYYLIISKDDIIIKILWIIMFSLNSINLVVVNLEDDTEYDFEPLQLILMICAGIGEAIALYLAFTTKSRFILSNTTYFYILSFISIVGYIFSTYRKVIGNIIRVILGILMNIMYIAAVISIIGCFLLIADGDLETVKNGLSVVILTLFLINLMGMLHIENDLDIAEVYLNGLIFTSIYLIVMIVLVGRNAPSLGKTGWLIGYTIVLIPLLLFTPIMYFTYQMIINEIKIIKEKRKNRKGFTNKFKKSIINGKESLKKLPDSIDRTLKPYLYEISGEPSPELKANLEKHIVVCPKCKQQIGKYDIICPHCFNAVALNSYLNIKN